MNEALKSVINRDVVTGIVCAASGAAIAATAVRVVRRRKTLKKANEELARFEYVPDPSNVQPDLWAEGTSEEWTEQSKEYVDLTKLYGPPGQFIGDTIEPAVLEAYTEVEQAAIAEANALVDEVLEEAAEEVLDEEEQLAQTMDDAGVIEDPDDDEEGEHQPNWGDPPLTMPDEGPEETEVTVHSVFAGSSGADQWDYDEEVPLRTPDKPYIIHKDEYFAGEMGFTQDSLIYYAGDDLMADSDNRLVPNHVRVVGELRFGHGSGDSGLVFVRNEKLKAEYEIALDPGTYQMAAYGVEYEGDPTELKHAMPRRFPRE